MPLLTPLERDHAAVEMIDRPASFEEIAGCLDTIVQLNGLFGGRCAMFDAFSARCPPTGP